MGLTQVAGKGRPTKYNKDMGEQAQKFFDKWEPYYEMPIEKQDKDGNVKTSMERVPNHPPTLGQLAEELGVTRTTIWRWEENHEDFCNILKKGIARCFEEGVWTNAITGNWNATMSIFAAKNKLNWTDRQAVEHSGTISIADQIKAKWKQTPGS